MRISDLPKPVKLTEEHCIVVDDGKTTTKITLRDLYEAMKIMILSTELDIVTVEVLNVQLGE